ncbi:hypothetical protein ElyMa_003528600 [Elysia marginata]|uniref:Uncharacterized protein n=1 Tax=Elysia marginata TaxID=1093978 RepID=A0AAV4EH38_9GAST|nr:hypothetical protein ElyMa_003528600 [Elysia marginata]
MASSVATNLKMLQVCASDIRRPRLELLCDERSRNFLPLAGSITHNSSALTISQILESLTPVSTPIKLAFFPGEKSRGKSAYRVFLAGREVNKVTPSSRQPIVLTSTLKPA